MTKKRILVVVWGCENRIFTLVSVQPQNERLLKMDAQRLKDVL